MACAPTAPDFFQAFFSPDGRWVCFNTAPTTDAERSAIGVVPAGGGAWRPLVAGNEWADKPWWSPDGRTIFFVSNRETGSLDVWGLGFDPETGSAVGEPFRVTSLSEPGRGLSPNFEQMEIAVARDRLFVPIREMKGGVWVLENVGDDAR